MPVPPSRLRRATDVLGLTRPGPPLPSWVLVALLALVPVAAGALLVLPWTGADRSLVVGGLVVGLAGVVCASLLRGLRRRPPR